MRRAAASGDKNAAAEAAAGLERLREAQRRLERGQAGRAQRDIAEMRQRAEQLASEQRSIASEVDETLGAGAQTAQGQQRVGNINSRKDELEQKVADLERQLDRTASETRREEKAASQKLSDAAGSIRDNKIKEKIRYSRNLLRSGSPEARGFEQSIGDNLEALRDKIGDAASALGARDRADRMAGSLDRTRDLVRGLESLDERMREAGRRGRQGRDQQARNREGRAGEQGQNGQQGQQGQEGQSGQSGEGQQANGQPNGGRDGYGPFGGPDGWNWGGGNRPWYWSGEDARQFRGEIREWSSEAQALRRDLREQGIDVSNLDEILRRLREFDSERVYKDPEELLRLQSFVVEGLKRFEYDLRRRVDAQNEQLFLAANDEAPASFRKLIEEYYRVLSKDQGR
jgi:ferritin-like metal-binding protein YciE